MNRRKFFKRLGQAVIAAPAVPSALAAVGPVWKGIAAAIAAEDQRRFVETFFYGRPLDTCGSISRATISRLSPAELNELFSEPRPPILLEEMKKLHDIEMKYCSEQPLSLQDFLR